MKAIVATVRGAAEALARVVAPVLVAPGAVECICIMQAAA